VNAINQVRTENRWAVVSVVNIELWPKQYKKTSWQNGAPGAIVGTNFAAAAGDRTGWPHAPTSAAPRIL
jgi:hypothetical protein